MKIELINFAALRQRLVELPEDLRHQAAAIVRRTAEEAQREIVRAYPRGRTGHLKAGVRLTTSASKVTILSAAPHAHLFEYGTHGRKTRTGHNRGVMPVAPESQRMVPIVIKARRQMAQRIAALITDTQMFQVLP